MGRQWFKHYSNASSGESIASLLINKDYRTVCAYWALLEEMALRDDGENDSFFLNLELFRRKLSLTRKQIESVFEKLELSFNIKCQKISSFDRRTELPRGRNLDDFLIISIPKWQSFQARWGGKRVSSGDQVAAKTGENRIRIEEEKEEEEEIERKKVAKKQNIDLSDRVEKSTPVISLYFKLYGERYGGKAPLTGKHYSLIKGLVKSVGVDRALQLLEGYFNMPDAYFVKRRHDVETLNGNLNQVAHFVDTGTIITNKQVRTADEQITNTQLLKQFEG